MTEPDRCRKCPHPHYVEQVPDKLDAVGIFIPAGSKVIAENRAVLDRLAADD